MSSVHTARGIAYTSWEGESNFKPPASHAGGSNSWLETLHRKHTSARSQRQNDVAQANTLKKELVTFFSLYRGDDLGRADELLREWKNGREIEDINRELKKKYQHNLFDLHELHGENSRRAYPLEHIILAERLKRAEADSEKERDEHAQVMERCELLENQNDQLRADLALAVEEGMKYRDNLREWAELEERRSLAQTTPGKKLAIEAAEDVGVLKREVEMLREARQKDMAAAKENFERELGKRDADVRVLKEEYQKLMKAKNEQELAAKQLQTEIRELQDENERLRDTARSLQNTAQQGVSRASELTSHLQAMQGESEAVRRENKDLQETIRKLQRDMQLEKDTSKVHKSAEIEKLREENETLRKENEIILKSSHELKRKAEQDRASSQEGREALSAMQRKTADLEKALQQNQAQAVSADEVRMLKMQIDMLKKENEEIRAQQEIRNRSSLDSINGLDETDSEMPSLDTTLAPFPQKGKDGPQTVMSSRSLGSMAKSPQQLADALASMSSAERFSAIKQGGIAPKDIAAAMSCCSPDDMLAIYHDLPAEIKARVFAALPESSRRYLVSKLSPEELAALLMACNEDERKLILAVVNTDHLAEALNVLSAIDRKSVMAQMSPALREAANLAEKIRKMDVPDRAQALVGIPSAEAPSVISFLAAQDVAPALDTMNRRDLTLILDYASPTKKAACAIHMRTVPRSVAYQYLPVPEKASVLMAVSPAEATLLLLGLDKSERTKVVTKLPAHVQDSIASADSLIKVPADERWDALLKLDLEDHGAATSWMPAKELLRMARTMPPSEAMKLFKRLQPDVCACVVENMTAEERALLLSGLPEKMMKLVVKLVPQSCLVASLTGMQPPSDGTVLSVLPKDEMDSIKFATALSKVEPAKAAETISAFAPEKIGPVLSGMDTNFTCAVVDEMSLATRKTTLANMWPETRLLVLQGMSALDRAKALNSMSPAHRSHALRALSAQSIAGSMSSMSSAERNLVTASLPAAARRALLKAKELNGKTSAEISQATADMTHDDRDRMLPWMESSKEAAALLSKDPQHQQVETLEGMSAEDQATLLAGMKPEEASALLLGIPLRLRLEIMRQMSLAAAGNAITKMPAAERKATLAVMSLEMEDAFLNWQSGKLEGDVKFGDSSRSAKMKKTDKTRDSSGAEDTNARRSRGKKDVKSLLDAGLLAAAFPNVSRVMRRTGTDVSTEKDSASD